MARERVLPRKYTLLRVLGLPMRVFARKLRALFAENENALFFTAVCLVGALGGLAGAAFRWMFLLATTGFWGRAGPLLEVAAGVPWWMRLLVPVLGAALAAAVTLLLAARPEERAGFPDILCRITSTATTAVGTTRPHSTTTPLSSPPIWRWSRRTRF